MTDLQRAVAERVREAGGQRALATLTGVSQSRISGVLVGRMTASPMFCGRLGIPVELATGLDHAGAARIGGRAKGLSYAEARARGGRMTELQRAVATAVDQAGSQAALAKLYGIHKSHVSKLLIGSAGAGKAIRRRLGLLPEPEPRRAEVPTEDFKAEVAARVAEEHAANLAAMAPAPAPVAEREGDGRAWIREALRRERERRTWTLAGLIEGRRRAAEVPTRGTSGGRMQAPRLPWYGPREDVTSSGG